MIPKYLSFCPTLCIKDWPYKACALEPDYPQVQVLSLPSVTQPSGFYSASLSLRCKVVIRNLTGAGEMA